MPSRNYQDNCTCEECIGIRSYWFETFHHTFRPIGKGPIYYGLELELECEDGSRSYRDCGCGDENCSSGGYDEADRDSICQVIDQTFTDRFATYHGDGSLDYGIEIVTQPASLAIHRSQWYQAMVAIKSQGLSANNGTGLHIHVSRRPLTKIQTAKIVCFVNARSNETFTDMIAGRNSGEWARKYNKKLTECAENNYARYEAVNLQNSNTIEFRLFKATTSYKMLMMRLEFVDALVSYTATGSRSISEAIDRISFISYVLSQREWKGKNAKVSRLRWPHLVGYIQAKWLGIETKVSAQFKVNTLSPLGRNDGARVSQLTKGGK